QTRTAPVRIVGHSLGGIVSLLYAGAFPGEVTRLVSIEGFGRPAQAGDPSAPERLRHWVARGREMSGRTPRRYRSLEEALERMQEANPHLSPDQARHLTIHGTNQNEDGSYSWKFDNYVYLHAPSDFAGDDVASIWAEIECQVLLIGGAESWATQSGGDFAQDFRAGRHELVPHAGHWVHHDQLDGVTNLVRDFLK